MFALRGFAVTFSAFAVLYCTLSVLIAVSWPRIQSWVENDRAGRIANFLFALRLFPSVAATLVTGLFVVPSFVRLEPRAIEEPLGAPPVILGLVGLGICVVGLVNALVAIRKASRTISTWIAAAAPLPSSKNFPVFRVASAIPPMIAVGILRPRVLLSAPAEFVLAPNELETAIHHEMAHIRRYDNLRKLLLRVVAFPGMQRLEVAWLEAAEMAADDAAVSSSREALDLAAALIKLSRLAVPERSPYLTAALVRVPASIMNARVERLLRWTPEANGPQSGRSFWYGVGFASVGLALLVLAYGASLARIHTATEWLVR
jgi:Zn-dependent protease with chaperone function